MCTYPTYTYMEFLIILLVITSVLLTILVLLQPKQAGLTLGVTSSSDFAQFERRGAEKFLHTATIVISIIFVLEVLAYFFFA